jgi:oxalate decarboxylase/phosphoglucose isomerase-like protein (cupin superfamily)
MTKVSIIDAVHYSHPAHNDCDYIYIQGEITITDRDGKDIVLKKHDPIYIGPAEGHSIINKTQYPSMMVILGVA